VGWYARALGRSDYAAGVLEVLGGRLAGCRDALDVGAGCGALAVPLAQRLDAVTALEPAPARFGRGAEPPSEFTRWGGRQSSCGAPG
jgi:hypothetical protein